MASRMRLPNGFGQITKITNKRLRSPWRAMVTIGLDKETGKYKRKTIGYYDTYNEAYEALIEYHKDPHEPDKDIDMNTLFKKWSEYYFNETRPNIERTYTYTWENFGAHLGNIKVSDIRSYHLKDAIEADMPPSVHEKVRSMFNLMFDYAVEYEITDKNYSRLANVRYDKPEKTKHFTLTTDEIKAVAEHPELEMQDAVMIQMYTGLRPQELMLIEKENINLKENTIIAGMKTVSGKNRTIPIHPFIKPLIEKRMEGDSKYLFGGMKYDGYKYRFGIIREKLSLNPRHQPHDMRVTFVTLAKKYNVNEYAIKRIVGHLIKDITEEIYTDREPDWLLREISRIPAPIDIV